MPVNPAKKVAMGPAPAPIKGGRQVETGKANPPAENQQVEKTAHPQYVRQVESGSVPFDRMGQPTKGSSVSYGRDGQPK